MVVQAFVDILQEGCFVVLAILYELGETPLEIWEANLEQLPELFLVQILEDVLNTSSVDDLESNGAVLQICFVFLGEFLDKLSVMEDTPEAAASVSFEALATSPCSSERSASSACTG